LEEIVFSHAALHAKHITQDPERPVDVDELPYYLGEREVVGTGTGSGWARGSRTHHRARRAILSGKCRSQAARATPIRTTYRCCRRTWKATTGTTETLSL
jgi:hypothetical protein